MCGICGVAALDGPLDPRIGDAVGAMTERLRHRGPDDAGYFRDRRASLGHRRLAIIDVARGAQPIGNEDGSIVLVFNGEIYNHVALRERLESRGHVFRTQSDSEAIVHAWEEFGVRCPEYLEGMFAFAIYDRRSGELFLARDRLGKKPLFWAIFDRTLHFASELVAMRQSPSWSGELDQESLRTYFSLGYTLAPSTVFRGVRKLEPGHWLHARDGSVREEQYWDVHDFDSDTRAPRQLIPALGEQFREHVEERLESEVPLGAFLSGGIDSGLVVSYMAESERLAEPPLTCSVGFREGDHNELEPAQRVAQRWRTRHEAHLCSFDLARQLEVIPALFDEPFADSSAVPTYEVCRIARQHVTVCLSGDGGDEVFGGYGFRYLPHLLESRARSLAPRALRRALIGPVASAWPRSAKLPKPLRLATYLENLTVDDASAYYFDLCCMTPDDAGRLLGVADSREDPLLETVRQVYQRPSSTSPIQRAQYADLKLYLPNDVLVKVDRMSMAHGLEVRSPLLDRRLVEEAFRIPTRTKLHHLEPKYLLRQLARGRLPEENLELPKRGFTAPVAEWFRSEWRREFESALTSSDSTISTVLDTEVVRQWLSQHTTGARNRSFELWAVWVLECWGRSTRTAAASVPAQTALNPT